MKEYNKCRNCLGKCPENCEFCIYNYCKKLVDYALTTYNYEKYINHIDTNKELEYEKKFYTWFKSYFRLNNSYKR